MHTDIRVYYILDTVQTDRQNTIMNTIPKQNDKTKTENGDGPKAPIKTGKR